MIQSFVVRNDIILALEKGLNYKIINRNTANCVRSLYVYKKMFEAISVHIL